MKNIIKNFRLRGEKIRFSALDMALPERGFCIPYNPDVRKSMGRWHSVFVSVT